MSSSADMFGRVENSDHPQCPLSDKECVGLLAPHEVIRDPLHGDIWITALERALIDTAAFQRLRGLKQLGPTHLVYPGAVHSRFLHSLGTVHWSEKLIEIANRNCETYCQPLFLSVSAYPHLLVRLSALLHDVAHMPFGHTLEDEGNLLKPEWKDQDRVEYWLGERAELSMKFVSFLVKSGISQKNAKTFLNDVRSYVTHHGNPMDLAYPFVRDLVGNTLCADLLDYADRDALFCGLTERTGDRVVRYLAVLRVISAGTGESPLFRISDDPAAKGRVVLLAYRFEREHSANGALKPVDKKEILSEAIDLLRRRFHIAEKVYFHRTKIAASAMLISATSSGAVGIRKSFQLSDEEFLQALSADSDSRAKHLVAAYQARRFYKTVYLHCFVKESDVDPESKRLWNNSYPEFRKPDWRREQEKTIEEVAELKPGSVAIYCPKRGMNLKRFEMLVQADPDGEVKQLSAILDTTRQLEMDAINQRFQELWHVAVFVDPEELDVSRMGDPHVQDVSKLCEELLRFPNHIKPLQGRGRSMKEQIAARVVKEYQQETGAKVPHDVYEECLAQLVHRDTSKSLYDSMRKHLIARMGEARGGPTAP